MYRGALMLGAVCLLADKAYTDTNYRLSTPITPVSYLIAITPYFDTNDDFNFTFHGQVEIVFKTETVTNQIQLHSDGLNFTASNVSLWYMGGQIRLNATNPLEFDTKYTFVYINVDSDMQVGPVYSLFIEYSGPIREDLNGFYRNYYMENGVKKWLGATQMEPTHARKVFPCLDEPHLKATFTLTIHRPAHFKPSLSNTKLLSTITLTNGLVREVFYPTPIMSTYLVAFLVSEFEAREIVNNNSREFGVYTRPQAKNQTAYAYDFGQRVVNALGDYFRIDYYSVDKNLKLDHIALPNFRAGAMENWGLVKYRESLLLYVPEESTPYYKYRVAQIIAHETTHMWFGNLVTCHWWSNTWLNEGFANYFQDYITALIEPEVGSADILVTGSVYEAYSADESSSTPAVTNDNVNSPAEISGRFGTITYQKAGSVIRMIHHLIGDEAFRDGLNAYLTENMLDVGYPDRLYASLQKGINTYNSLSDYPGFYISDILSSWVVQAGHPIVHATVNDDDTVTLTQKRFYTQSGAHSNEIYNIPITYTTESSPDFNSTKPAFIMDNVKHTFTIANISAEHEWILFNIQETGFYRVNYDDHTWHHISNALNGSQRENIHYLNRAKIVNDLFAFLYADEVKFSRLYEVFEFLTEETDYSVWYAALRGFNKLRNVYFGTEVQKEIDEYALRLLDNIIYTLGYDVNGTDDFVTLRNRMQILEFSCKIGHRGCIDYSVGLFKGLKDNQTEIPPSLRPVAYCNGLRHGDGDDYDFLWSRMSTTNIANEARLIGEVLGCTRVEDKLKSYLVSMLQKDSPIMSQDLTVPLTSVLSDFNNARLVIEELEKNFALWSIIYSSMDPILSAVASALHTHEEFDQFEGFLSSCSGCSQQAKNAATSALNSAKQQTIWAENHKTDILHSLRNNAIIATPSLFTLAVCAVIATFFKF